MNDNIYYLITLGTAGALLLAGSVIFFYIRYQSRFLAQKAEIQRKDLEHRQYLLNAIIQSQENERVRISKDLHDHVGSSLSNLRFMVSRIQAAAPELRAVQQIAAEYKASIDAVIEDVRNISHSLSPAGLALWGFHEALEDFCIKMARSSGLEIRVTDRTEGMLKQLPFESSLSLFRVIQELLANTIRHAGARSVSITTTDRQDAVVVEYRDDGKGTNANVFNRKGIGMYNIECRLQMIKARFEVKTAEGAGFQFTITLPQSILNKTMLYD